MLRETFNCGKTHKFGKGQANSHAVFDTRDDIRRLERSAPEIEEKVVSAADGIFGPAQGVAPDDFELPLEGIARGEQQAGVVG